MKNKNAAVFGQIFVLFIFFFSLLPVPAYPAQTAGPPAVTVDEAQQLVLAISESMGWTKLNGFSLEPYESKTFPAFYFFSAMWDNPDGSAMIDHLAVDRRTGAVWSAIVCREFSSKKLRRAQFDLRRKIGLTKDEFRKIKRLGPMCD